MGDHLVGRPVDGGDYHGSREGFRWGLGGHERTMGAGRGDFMKYYSFYDGRIQDRSFTIIYNLYTETNMIAKMQFKTCKGFI